MSWTSKQMSVYTTSKSAYSPKGFIDSEWEDGTICAGDWRNLIPGVESAFSPLPKAKGGRSLENAKDTCVSYLCS